MRYAVALLIAVALAGCMSAGAGRFRNNYPHPEKTGFWKWKWEQWRDGLPRRPEGGYRFETARSELCRRSTRR